MAKKGEFKPGDYGKASISPEFALAGQKGRWEFLYTVGKLGLRKGGSLRLIPPFCHDLWHFGKVTAFCSDPDAYLEVLLENVCPPSYHHSMYPAATVVVYGSDLKPGETVRIVLGDLGGYVSGRFVQSQAITHACETRFQLLVDWKGNGRFCREKHRPQAYQPCAGALKMTVKPNKPARIRCTVRNRPAEGQNLRGVLAVEDEFENPVKDTAFDIALRTEQGRLGAPERIAKPKNRQGAAFRVKGVGEGVHYLGASSWARGLYGLSNPVCPGFAFSGDNIYFGDMHVMTASCGNPHMTGTTEYALKYARDVFGLDFTAVTNSFRPDCWAADCELFRQYNVDGEFVTIPALELGWLTGHKNVYFLEEGDFPERPDSLKRLWEMLGGRECMAIAHHPNTHSETDRELSWGPHDLSTINPKYEQLFEITQNRGPAEVDEVGGETSFGGFGSSARDALARGLRLGFVGGTDTHRARPGSRMSNQSGLDSRTAVTGGITGVLCKELTRKAVWQALKARRCYATTSIQALMDFELNGHGMGEDVRLAKAGMAAHSKRTARVKVAGTRPLTRIVFVRNGQEVHTVQCNGMAAEAEWVDKAPLADIRDRKIRGAYYYAKFYQEDGNMGWSSPVWLSD